MKRPSKNSVFLERANYRRRRLGDAARFLPIIGAVLWLIPLMWQTDGPEAQSNATTLTYIFVIWVLLIALAALLSRVLRDGVVAADDTTR